MGVIVPPFIGLLGGSKNNACDTEKHFPDVSCGLSGVVPQHLWNNRKGDPFLKRGSLCPVPACPSPDLPCHRTELWMNIYCTCSQQGHPVIRLTTPISLSFLWTVPSSSSKLRPHFISEMKFDFLCLNPGRKLKLVVLHPVWYIHKGFVKLCSGLHPGPVRPETQGAAQARVLFTASWMIPECSQGCDLAQMVPSGIFQQRTCDFTIRRCGTTSRCVWRLLRGRVVGGGRIKSQDGTL